ncbi:MAG: patatin-like phospholipase family protein [Cyclobacteriaceae bacterium]
MKIGLALSGGGIRGMAHLGVIKALSEAGLKIEQISGTSAGSLVGALYSAGHSPNDILKIVEDAKLLKLLRPAFNTKAFIKMDGIANVLKDFLPATFNSLKIPLSVSATNINTGKNKIFDSGQLVPSLLASCCIPVIFHHITINNDDYVDGGITNNFPIEPLENSCNVLIGSHSNFISDQYDDFNMKTILERSMLIAISGNVYPKADRCNLFIDPPKLGLISGFELKKAREIFEIGYAYTTELLREKPIEM